jgi:hypothetical protein
MKITTCQCGHHYVKHSNLGVVVVDREQILRRSTELLIHLLADIIRPRAGAIIEKLLSGGN